MPLTLTRNDMKAVHAMKEARVAGHHVLFVSANRNRAVSARDACGLGRGFIHKVGKGTIRFDWVGRVRRGIEPQPFHVVIDECTRGELVAMLG